MAKCKSSTLDGFDAFWAAYPRHDARKDALKAWATLSPSPDLQAEILSALAWQCDLPDWRKHGGQFVPLPATYLRGERWTDERRSGHDRRAALSPITEAAMRALEDAQ